MLRPGGTIIVVGIPETDKWSLDADYARRREITVQFVRRQVNCVEPSIGLMSSGKVDISRMITHRFPFERTQEAFELVAGYRNGVMKAMIDF
jgi:L-iditol 2-dehydrogenase